MKYVFFLDIDGTLTWGSSIPEENIRLIERAQKDGHPVLINTGRSLKFIPQFVLDSISFDGIVAGLGSYCSLGDRVLKAEEMPRYQLKSTFDYLASRDRRFIFEGENEVLVYGPSSHFPSISSADELDTVYSHVRVEKIYISGILEREEFQKLSESFFTLQHGDYAECAIKGCDKAKGMKLIMDCFPRDWRSIAMGDSVNDIQMLQAADVAVAMGNAPDSVKALCHTVSCHAKDGGLAKAFAQILGYGEKGEDTV